MFLNRLAKNKKRLFSMLKEQNLSSLRLYDRDLPNFPFIIEVFYDYRDEALENAHVVLWNKTHPKMETEEESKMKEDEVIAALKDVFKDSEIKIYLKGRRQQKGSEQYEKLDVKNETILIKEAQAIVEVNLSDYLDTGIYMDHRPVRKWIPKKRQNKRLLNLFCYTGVVSVQAALGEMKVTSVDMSKTYIEWVKRNFEYSGLDCSGHEFINRDVIQYLKELKDESFDVIFCDPPTFSNSKKMESTFEVEREQEFLINRCMDNLAKDGVLYFSNNKRSFKLSPTVVANYQVREVTSKSIPRDFHDGKIHHLFEIRFSNLNFS